MKILYGVAGEGFGHSSRAKEILTHLEKNKHQVLVATYGQAINVLKNFNTIKIKGVTLLFKKNRLSLRRTIFYNTRVLSKNIKNWNIIKRKIDKFSPEICISDMEPLVPIISHFSKLPLISIDNQHRLTHLKLDVPKKCKKDFLTAKIAIDACVSKADAFIILSFTKDKTKEKNSYIVSPLLRKDILRLKPHKTNKVLVYHTKPNKNFIEILKKIPEKFVIYGYNKKEKQKNLEFKKSGKWFIKDLAKCKAVIATAGFTLISEALYLKKPYFAIPLKGQFEQTFNALYLKRSGLGTFSEDPTQKDIFLFLKDLKKYENKLKEHKMDPSETITRLDKILYKIQYQNYGNLI